MPAFTDTQGRTWPVEVNVATVKRVRSLLGVDLLTIVEDQCKLLADLADDPVLLVDVLYVLCKDEADRQQVTDEDFGRAMAGDCLLAGFDALLEGLEGFFQDAGRREAVATVIAKTRRLAGLLIDHTNRQLAAIDVDDAFTRLTTPAPSSTDSPASSGSTPAPSPSAS